MNIFSIGGIIRKYCEDFYKKHNVVGQVRKTFAALGACRTEQLGGHIEKCPQCGFLRYVFRSCRDRHCPNCQNKDRALWVQKRKEEVIPGTRYFHVVFTVPACLHELAISNMAIFYDCLMRASWTTLKSFFGKNKLQGGMTAILHTWGSNLSYHPHVHCIVPGGGVDKQGKWHSLKGCKNASSYLFPVNALSQVFRANMLNLLTRALKEKGITIPQKVRKQCFDTDWNVNCRPPAKGVNQVIEYIGRYAYRVAITDSRIKDVSPDGIVKFDWKDYRSGGKHKIMAIHAVDFLYLFSLHILPHAFVRIRHYGILSPSNRDKLRSVQIQLNGTPVPKQRTKPSYLQICIDNGWEIGVCPKCGCQMTVEESIRPPDPPPKKPALLSYYPAV